MNNKMKFFFIATIFMVITAYQLGQAGTSPINHPVNAEMTEEEVVNDNAIRIRVIPHSNAFEDQLSKRIARYAIDELLADNAGALGSVESTRAFLASNVTTVHNRLSEIFGSIGYETSFEVTFGQHLFPENQWEGEVFPAGYYESLVVRIGEGRGNNWWCFVNPGVCLGPSLNDMEAPSTSEGWNFLYQVRETAQSALLNGDFSFYMSGLFENWFGSGEVQPQVAPIAINWYLFDDEK